MLVIECSTVLEGTKLGDSIAVNGVDLTCAHMDGASLTFDVMPETFRRSNLAERTAGRPREPRALGAPDRPALGAHRARRRRDDLHPRSLTPEGDAIIARYRTPPEFLRYIVMKGPVCVDGVSLTVMARTSESFSVSLVQYTQEHTNLTRRQAR